LVLVGEGDFLTLSIFLDDFGECLLLTEGFFDFTELSFNFGFDSVLLDSGIIFAGVWNLSLVVFATDGFSDFFGETVLF